MSTNNTEREPILRFPGFITPWKQRKLNDVAKYRNGKAHENDISDTGSFIVVNSKFVSTDGLVRKYSNKQIEPLMKDEIAFVLSDVPNGRAIARTFLVDESNKYTLNQRIAGITPLDITYPYFLHILMNRNSYFLAFDDGVKQTNLSLADVMNFEEMYPSFDEQKKIGDFFAIVNNLITLCQRKCDELEKYKNGLLQQLFPQPGEVFPRLRFPGYTEPWEQRKVKDVCSVSTGKSNTQDKVDDGEYPFYVRSPIIEHSNKFLFDEEAVLTVGDGVGTGKVFHYVNGKYDLHQRVYRLFGFSEDTDAKFFYHWFSSHFYDRVMSMTAKTSVDSVRLEMISDMNFIAPGVEEQRRIASCLGYLDNIITLHQRKCDELKTYKNGLLQKMLL